MNPFSFRKITLVVTGVLMSVVWQTPSLQISQAETFSPGTWKAGEDCQWISSVTSEIRFPAGDLYLAKPDSPEKREQWLNAIRRYRQSVRGELGTDAEPWVDVNFQGVRAWLRMENDLAKAHGLLPGQEIVWQLEARWIAGNNELCAAFDFPTRASNVWNSWSSVRETAKIPQDGQWHELTIRVKVPEFNTETLYAKPIIGMDATHNAQKGNIHLRHVKLTIDHPTDEQNQSLAAFRPSQSKNLGIDRSLYDEPSQHWLTGAYTCHFTFMYDRSFYDPESGQYTMKSFLDDGEKEFGGYDVLLLWHAYPRIGADRRNQLDFYRDMPGGIEGLRDMVRQCHERNVRVFINYNPWDVGTHREGKSDEDFLTELVGETRIDGIFLDTMVGDSPVLRQKLNAVRPGIVLSPEGNPSINDLGICNSSWAQWCNDPEPPSLDHRKWLEPRHTRWQIWRWNLSHREEIRRAFFGGGGMIVWENIFGTYNPWNAEDRRLWRNAASILKQYRDLFSSDAWEPYYPACCDSQDATVKADAQRGLFVHRWPGERGESLFTVWATGAPLTKETGPPVSYGQMDFALFDVPWSEDMRYFDLWNGREITPTKQGDRAVIRGMIDRVSGLGCFLEIPKNEVNDALMQFVAGRNRMSREPITFNDTRNFAYSVEQPLPVEKTPVATRNTIPAGMALIPGQLVNMKLEHTRRECGCYPDLGMPAHLAEALTWGNACFAKLEHDYQVEVDSFLIDETEVTNAQFLEFLRATNYRPKYSENFLAHWPNGRMPEELADHPVVYVDLDDARAYAKWAGKRLPTEAEWQLAAQGTDGRLWPWGGEMDFNHPDPNRVNTTGKTMPVKSLPEGRSPFGCYHMSGNVYEWTESRRDDGHTRFAIIRGGSFFQAMGSGWYVDGGPRPCNHHAKFLLMWPGLDRCDTIGFRCVKDVK